MAKVSLEMAPLLAETLGIDSRSKEIISDQDTEGGNSVRELLNRLGAKYINGCRADCVNLVRLVSLFYTMSPLRLSVDNEIAP